MKNRFAMIFAVLRHTVTVFAGIVSVALLGRKLGVDALGAWALIGTSSTIVALADMGFNTLVLRDSVRAQEGETLQREAFETMQLAQWTVLLSAPAFVALAYVVYLQSLGATLDPRVASRSVFLLAVVGVMIAGVVNAYSNIHRAWLVGQGQTPVLALARTTGALVQVLVTVIALWGALGVAAPALGVASSAVIDAVLSMIAARRVHRMVPVFPDKMLSVGRWLTLAREALASMAVNGACAVAVRLDVAVLVRVAPLAAIAAHQISLRVSDQLYAIVKQLSTAVQHRLGSSSGRANELFRGTVLLTGLLAAVLIAVATCGRPALRAWAGPAVDHPLWLVSMPIVAFASLLAICCELASATLVVAAPTQWDSARPHLIGAIANMGLTVGLASHFGLAGVAFATIVGNGLTALCTWHSLHGVEPLDWRAFRESFYSIFATLLVALVSGLALSRWVHGVLSSLIAMSVCGLLTVGTLAWMMHRSSQRKIACTSVSLVQATVLQGD